MLSRWNFVDNLNQWFLTFTSAPNPYVVFQAFVKPQFCPI